LSNLTESKDSIIKFNLIDIVDVHLIFVREPRKSEFIIMSDASVATRSFIP